MEKTYWSNGRPKQKKPLPPTLDDIGANSEQLDKRVYIRSINNNNSFDTFSQIKKQYIVTEKKDNRENVVFNV